MWSMRLRGLLALLVVTAAVSGAVRVGAATQKPPFKATLTAPTHTPKVNKKWYYVVRVTDLHGKPIKARLTAQIKDPVRNGGRKVEELIHHIGEDTLVGWAWAPGYGRSAAPGTQKIAGALVEAWVKTGAACPAN